MISDLRFIFRAGLAFTLAATVSLAVYASSADAKAHAVQLSDARVAPTFLAYVKAGTSVTVPSGRQCARGTYFSDISAYRWNGKALGAQRWSDDLTGYYWRDSRGGRVTFDGITFRNATRSPVLAAGWCE